MAGPRKISVSEASRPILPRHAKLKFDETRKVWVILAPERVLAPDEIAVEVLQLCDGIRNVGQMADALAAKYAAEREGIREVALSGGVAYNRAIRTTIEREVAAAGLAFVTSREYPLGDGCVSFGQCVYAGAVVRGERP